jgi:hypothetical protein
MRDSLSAPPAGNAGVLETGVALGESIAFGLVSGRTSAAQAACLHRLREEKLYKSVEPHWSDFCSKYLKVSRTEADRTIRLWQEFGPGYFEVSQLARVSPETYRAIAPAVKDGALHFEGEAIELNPDNSRRVAAAVAGLRRALPAKRPAPQLEPHERIEDLERRSTAFILEFDDISRRERHGENWLAFTRMLDRVRSALDRIARENGIK